MKKLEEKIEDCWTKFKIYSLILMTTTSLAFVLLSLSRVYAQKTKNPIPSTTIQYGVYGNDSPKLRVVVPGINTRGQQMLENAKRELRYDAECTVIIEEAEGWTVENNYIRENIIKATQKAIEKHKDVIVLLDMDLEHNIVTSHLTPEQLANLPIVGTRWFKATDWAGSMMNNVSQIYNQVFQEKGIIRGNKECEAHSAGADAFEQSLVLSNRRMFDQVNLFNGRTTTSELVPQIKADGYTSSQINIFLTEGELLANPHSISNLNAVIPHAGRVFTVYYCDEKPSTNRMQNHSALVNEPLISRSFEVYSGQKLYKTNATVEDIKSGYLRPEIDGSKNIRSDLIQTNLENRLGGILLDKDNTYLIDEGGTINEIKESALEARKDKGEISWRFEYEGQEHQFVALPFGKKQKPKKFRLYHNPQQNVVVSCEDDNVIALRYTPKNDFFQIIQVAQGKVIGEKDNHPIFKIDRVLMTDYPLKIDKNWKSGDTLSISPSH